MSGQAMHEVIVSFPFSPSVIIDLIGRENLMRSASLIFLAHARPDIRVNARRAFTASGSVDHSTFSPSEGP